MCFRWIAVGAIGFAEQIIDACVVEARESDEHIGGNMMYAAFVFGIARLGHVQMIGQVLLLQIAIFAQISNSRIFHVHHRSQYTYSDLDYC